jgi:hypothetical protein
LKGKKKFPPLWWGRERVGGDCCEEIQRLGNRKRQSCLSSLYEREKFPSLKKRG